MSAASDHRFHIELFKLLLTIAWSDGRIEPRERERMEGLARRWEIPEADLPPLLAALAGGGSALPPANITLLRERPAEVMEAARDLAAADGAHDGWEESILQQIAAVLGVAARR